MDDIIFFIIFIILKVMFKVFMGVILWIFFLNIYIIWSVLYNFLILNIYNFGIYFFIVGYLKNCICINIREYFILSLVYNL